ncbi:MAG: porin family protein [Bacteroidaceae bacterium]
MKRPLILVAILAICTAAHAQVGEARQDLSVGVNGGYVLNKVSFNPTIKQNFHTGTTFGLTLRYTCEKYFAALCALQAEVNYTGMGWKENIETSSDTYERQINYIQIPLLANLGFGRERGGAKGFILLGPQISFCINEKEKKGGEWSDENLSKRPNQIIEQYSLNVQKKFEYGLTGGAGLDLSTRSGHHFLLEGRYYYALSDIFKNSKKDPFGRSANGAIIIKASYLFDIIKTKK